MTHRWFIVAGLLVACALAALLSPLASSSPDGLERVAMDHGFLDKVSEPAWTNSPAPDYSLPGIAHEGGSTAAAGLLGTLLTFAGCWVLFRVVGRRKAGEAAPSEPS